MNDIIWKAIKRAQVPAVKEPVSLTLEDNKRPDGTTVLSWAKGKKSGLGCHSPRHLCRVTHRWQCPPQGRQLIQRRHNTRLTSTPNWQAHTRSIPLL